MSPKVHFTNPKCRRTYRISQLRTSCGEVVSTTLFSMNSGFGAIQILIQHILNIIPALMSLSSATTDDRQKSPFSTTTDK